MECVAAYLESSSISSHRDVNFHFDVRFNKTILHTSAAIEQFSHRQWVHLCVSFSTITGDQRTYYNGQLVGFTKTFLKDGSVILRRSLDGVIDSSFIFGQEPDTIRGSFEAHQAFIGDLAELNVWNHVLTTDQILKMSKCNDWSIGNAISWKKSSIKMHDVKMQDVSNGSLFCQSLRHFIMFPEKVALEKAKMTCKLHGGKIAVPSSKEESEMMVNIAKEHKTNCIVDDKVVWLGIIKRNHVWYEIGENKTLGQSYSNWNRISPFPNKDCAFMQQDGSWHSTWGSACQWGNALCTICAIDNTPIFTLKGHCTLSAIDNNYYLSLDGKHQIQYFEGYRDTILSKSNENEIWRFMERGEISTKYTTKLVTGNSSENYPIGRKIWMMTDPRCTYQSSTNILTLSMCIFGTEFTCDSGKCIDLWRRCDEIEDCDDKSDEINCRLIDMPESYVKTSYPPPTSPGKKVLIYTHVEITNVHHVDTINMLITLTTKIQMRWKDPRIMFLNPRIDKKNIVSQQFAEKMWLPTDQIRLTNAIIGEIRKAPNRKVQVYPDIPENMDSESPYENRRYNGSYNFLRVSQRMKVKYNCTFNV